MIAYPTIEHVAMQARPYPADLLVGCATGLCLFAAAFLGHNDAIHFARRDVPAICVDVDGDRLETMRALYPGSWEFVEADAWKYAEAAADLELSWDAVSADTFTGHKWETQTIAAVPIWAAIANRLVTFTATSRMRSSLRAPAGWELGFYERATDVYWGVLTR